MTNTILYRKNRIFFFLLFFFILLFITLYSCTNQKNDKITYYYSGDKKIEVRVVQDTLGILLYRNRSGLIKADSINSFANKLGANYVKSLSENIILVTKQGTGDKTITQASQSATSLKQKNPGVVSKAGYLIYQKTSKVPLIVTDELIIKFKNGTGQQEITKFLNKHKLKIISQSPNSKNEYLVSIADNKKLNTLKASEVFNKNKLVDYSEPNFVMVTDYRGFDPMVSPWHHYNTGISPGGGNPGGVEDADLDTDLAWSFTKGNNVKIAVIDVGFDMMHHELTPNFDINTVEIPNNGIDDPPQNGYVDDDIGWDFNDCIDENNPGCGTNMAATTLLSSMTMGKA